MEGWRAGAGHQAPTRWAGLCRAALTRPYSGWRGHGVKCPACQDQCRARHHTLKLNLQSCGAPATLCLPSSSSGMGSPGPAGPPAPWGGGSRSRPGAGRGQVCDAPRVPWWTQEGPARRPACPGRGQLSYRPGHARGPKPAAATLPAHTKARGRNWPASHPPGRPPGPFLDSKVLGPPRGWRCSSAGVCTCYPRSVTHHPRRRRQSGQAAGHRPRCA